MLRIHKILQRLYMRISKINNQMFEKCLSVWHDAGHLLAWVCLKAWRFLDVSTGRRPDLETRHLSSVWMRRVRAQAMAFETTPPIRSVYADTFQARASAVWPVFRRFHRNQWTQHKFIPAAHIAKAMAAADASCQPWFLGPSRVTRYRC